MTRKNTRLLLFAAAILIGFFFNHDVNASGIQMNLTLGYGGYISPEHWNPLRIEINGVTNASKLEITSLEDESGHQIIESYAIRGLTRVEVPVFATENTKSLQIRLLDGAQLITEQILDMKTKVFPGQLILTVDLPVSAQQAIAGALLPMEPVLAVPLDIHDLPGMSLNYDGVTCLVLNNFKPLLTPAQLKALRNWMTGGGRIVVSGVDQDLQTLSNTFGITPRESSDGLNARVGLGSIRIIPSELYESEWSGDFQKWRQILALKRFNETSRLNTTYCFPMPLEISGKKATFPYLFIIFPLIFWALAARTLIFLNRKNFIAQILIFTLISSILAFTLAGYFNSIWHRGAVTHTRAIVLPEQGGMIMNMQAQMNSSIYVAWYNASPWGADMTFKKDEQGGIDLNRELMFWNHHLSQPFFSMRSGKSNVTDTFTIAGKSAVFDLTGWFSGVSLNLNPGDTLRGSAPGESSPVMMPVTAQTVSWDGKQWRLLKSDARGDWQWLNVSSPPPWFAMDQDWLKKLQLKTPDIIWLGGRSILPPGLRLKIQKSDLGEVFWAMPYLKK